MSERKISVQKILSDILNSLCATFDIREKILNFK